MTELHMSVRNGAKLWKGVENWGGGGETMAEHGPKEVAELMRAEFERLGELLQEDAVNAVQRKFGKQFVYLNENGNPAIHKGVLKEFKKITPDAVWERGEKLWRRRNKFDDPKTRQQE
jgi:hypothetical protein